ncbi:MAG: hypothetical protein AB7G75_08230 [Candidatus Binatia bacterium]
MREDCHRIDEIDVAAFLTDPGLPTWEAFRRHYPTCASCRAEVYKWTQLEQSLRAMGSNTSMSPHPSVETLTHFRTRPNRLALDTRQLVEQHLRTCAPCREEVNLLGSFDFSLVRRWAAHASDKREQRTMRAIIDRVGEVLRVLVLHPAFAYSLVFLLSVPLIRSYYSSSVDNMEAPVSTSVPAPSDLKRQLADEVKTRESASSLVQEPISPEKTVQSVEERANEAWAPTSLAKQSTSRNDLGAAEESVPVPALSASPPQARQEAEAPAKEETQKDGGKKLEREQRFSPVFSGTPGQRRTKIDTRGVLRDQTFAAILSSLFDSYKAAYEARDLNRLGQIWQLDQQWRDSLRTLFVASRRLALLVGPNEQRVETGENGERVIVPFVQSATLIDHKGQITSYGPAFCVAEVRQQPSGKWIIRTLQEDPLHPGQCQPW